MGTKSSVGDFESIVSSFSEDDTELVREPSDSKVEPKGVDDDGDDAW